VRTLQIPYVSDLYTYRRRKTRVVMVGDMGVGGDNPIRVQSMTTTLTKDVEATVVQAERLVQAGCEIVRITTPTPADARCMGPIREGLAARGVHVPLVADIHFNPLAAMTAADFADKVRINPGNYVDSRKFAVREYTDAQYEEELERIEARFTPLVLKCKERGIALRIGTNHGSLSDRIMNRFGDTPEGMVESALEFVRICEKYNYHDIILSMKASNPKVMIAAYRLLAARMARLGMDYPFHLGVTEAGNAEDGRIKSAIGIGSLLEDGIGDTIRVSLTEEPEEEIPVAFAIAGRYHGREEHRNEDSDVDVPWDPYHFQRRTTRGAELGDVRIGSDHTIAVIATIDGPLAQQPSAMARILRWASPAGRRQPKPDAALVTLELPDDLETLQRVSERLAKWPQARLSLLAAGGRANLLLGALELVDGIVVDPDRIDDLDIVMNAVRQNYPRAAVIFQSRVEDLPREGESVCRLVDTASRYACENILLALEAAEQDLIHAYRRLAVRCSERRVDVPILLRIRASSDPLLPASIALGSLLCDGIGDAVVIDGMEDASGLEFNILQAAGARITKTDYVACPSCGRTLFDLQETTDRIKQRTSHLVGVKLAIMGCIVNGPGEMADADFGYVGGAPGQVNLYVGKECVERGVPAAVADDRLIELIKSHGKWVEDEE
jgi:(E)-4-hydroxy-3-methylbut-2-enyl-diphosphate synthase